VSYLKLRGGNRRCQQPACKKRNTPMLSATTKNLGDKFEIRRTTTGAIRLSIAKSM
jgi:hypothetical protein